MFNGPLYIPVVSLDLLTEGRTARDLPKQRRQNKATLKDGILRGVFTQQAARAWYGCRAEKAQVTVLLPGKCCFSKWTDMVDCMPHSWPKSFNIGRMQIVPYLLGLLAMIKCSICFYQCDN